jgi:tetratricopeptide (TPR) repeat protein
VSEQLPIHIDSSGAGSAVSGSGPATVNNINNITYQAAPPAPVSEEVVATALLRVQAMPLDTVPPPADLPDGSRMPFKANPLFVGRGNELQTLAARLKAGDTASISPVAATGLGGLGKTQLAVEFVHRYGQFFAGGAYWLGFAEAKNILTEIAACGDVRQYPYLRNLSLEDQVRHVLSEWQSPLPRLLVFDNCEEEAPLDRWRPPAGGARVLVTSRRGEWSAVLGVQVLPLGVLGRADSVALLRRHRPDLPEDDPDLHAMAAELGDLPLAIELAGSFLARYRAVVTPATYLADLRHPNLLDHRSFTGRGISATGHELSVGRTFALSYNRLDATDPIDTLARALLARAAYFAPGEPIPRDWLVATLDVDPLNADTPYQTQDALNRLLELSLLERQADDTVRLHRLLATFVLNEASDAAAQQAVERVVLTQAARSREAGSAAQQARMLPHLRTVTEAALERNDESAVRLRNELGSYMLNLGEFSQARSLFERAVASCEANPGCSNYTKVDGLNGLGEALRSLEDYVKARDRHQQALDIATKFGPADPRLADSHRGLGAALRWLEDRPRSLDHHRKALRIYETAFGPDDRRIVTSLIRVATAHRHFGRYPEALSYLDRALEIVERSASGPLDLDRAYALGRMGSVYVRMHQYQDAQRCNQQAKDIFEAAFGHNHPEVAYNLRHLGDAQAGVAMLRAKSAHEQVEAIAAAKDNYEQALHIFTATLGPDHRRTKRVREHLASLTGRATVPPVERP